jgi:hypothetical protein
LIFPHPEGEQRAHAGQTQENRRVHNNRNNFRGRPNNPFSSRTIVSGRWCATLTGRSPHQTVASGETILSTKGETQKRKLPLTKDVQLFRYFQLLVVKGLVTFIQKAITGDYHFKFEALFLRDGLNFVS